MLMYPAYCLLHCTYLGDGKLASMLIKVGKYHRKILMLLILSLQGLIQLSQHVLKQA